MKTRLMVLNRQCLSFCGLTCFQAILTWRYINLVLILKRKRRRRSKQSQMIVQTHWWGKHSSSTPSTTFGFGITMMNSTLFFYQFLKLSLSIIYSFGNFLYLFIKKNIISGVVKSNKVARVVFMSLILYNWLTRWEICAPTHSITEPKALNNMVPLMIVTLLNCFHFIFIPFFFFLLLWIIVWW